MTDWVLLLGIVAGCAIAIMVVFLAFRAIVDWIAARRRQRLHEQEEGIKLVSNLPVGHRKLSWRERIDLAFEGMLFRTGLGLSHQQAVGWILLFGILVAGGLLIGQSEFWLAGVGLLLGMGLPLTFYLVLQSRWRRQIQDQLPDTLFLLSRSMRAGLSLEQAIDNVAENGNRPIADEFRRGMQQVKLGLNVTTALQAMGNRIRLPDFDVLVTIVTLHRKVGGNLSLLLDRVAATTRDRNLFRGYLKAATALARITAYFLAAGAPVLFIGFLLWQPDFAQRFLQRPEGLRFLAVAGVLEIVGIIWLSFLLRTRY